MEISTDPHAASPAMPAPIAEPEFIRHAADDLGFEWARKAWARAARVPGAWFDEAKAQAAVELWPQVFVHTLDRFAGRPFKLNAWEEVIVRLLVGWKVPFQDEAGVIYVRLFRRIDLWVPRKNGKSEFLAALALLFFALEGTVGGEGFCFAVDENQGRIVFSRMATMVALSPRLQKSVIAFKKSLWVPKIRAAFELLSGKPGGKHGKSPTVITGDEKHEWTEDTAELADTLRQGTGGRLQPIELYASTAGLKSNRIGYGLWSESVDILEERLDDATTLVVIFALDQDADPFDEKNWAKANPSIGVSPTYEYMRREAALARQSTPAEAKFRRYHCNQWVEQQVAWLKRKDWKACTARADGWRDADQLKGRECFLAFDVGNVSDLFCRVLLFPPVGEGEGFKTLFKFWVPEETLAERVARDRVPYDKWKAAGALETTGGNAVDQDYVREQIKSDLTDYKVLSIGFDPWNATKLASDLQKDGVNADLFVEIRQGHKTLGEPTKEFERLVLAHRFDHGNHPVLNWMADHCDVRFDENMNYVPSKRRSSEKIDGIVVSVMALGLWLGREPVEKSYLESSELMVL